MIQLNEAANVSEPSSPVSNKILTYKQRKLWKNYIRITIFSVFVTVCYFIGRSIHWDSISENYRFNSKDLDFIQYFCSETQKTTNMAKILELEKELEHNKVGYLDYENFVPDTAIPSSVWDNLPVKGAYYMVVRNENLVDAKSVIKSMEDRMVNGTRYPWIFLNNQPFTVEFRKYIRKVTTAPVFFGKIDLEAWEYPYWIDVRRAEYLMFKQELNEVYRGGSLSYRQLFRYQSGFFFHHPLFQDVQYTWRVEPGADYTCEMNDDKFLEMKEQNKTLGFVLTLHESSKTIPTLWKRVVEFVDLNPDYILPFNETIFPWIYDSQNKGYNTCHFWTNFQIADLSFFRSEAYQKYFKYLDNTGNFFYERWSDAPVQTIAAALFLKKEQIHFFNDIGYSHSVASHCPLSDTHIHKCSCEIASSFDFHGGSCTANLLKLIEPKTLKEMKHFVSKKNLKF